MKKPRRLLAGLQSLPKPQHGYVSVSREDWLKISLHFGFVPCEPFNPPGEPTHHGCGSDRSVSIVTRDGWTVRDDYWQRYQAATAVARVRTAMADVSPAIVSAAAGLQSIGRIFRDMGPIVQSRLRDEEIGVVAEPYDAGWQYEAACQRCRQNLRMYWDSAEPSVHYMCTCGQRYHVRQPLLSELTTQQQDFVRHRAGAANPVEMEIDVEEYYGQHPTQVTSGLHSIGVELNSGYRQFNLDFVANEFSIIEPTAQVPRMEMTVVGLCPVCQDSLEVHDDSTWRCRGCHALGRGGIVIDQSPQDTFMNCLPCTPQRFRQVYHTFYNSDPAQLTFDGPTCILHTQGQTVSYLQYRWMGSPWGYMTTRPDAGGMAYYLVPDIDERLLAR